MDEDLKIVSLEERRPWYKRAWNKVKKIASSIGEWCLDHVEVLTAIWLSLVAGLWGFILGFISGREEGTKIGHRKGWSEGYEDCCDNLKESGYKVYTALGSDFGDCVVKKVSEEHVDKVTEEDV